MGQPGRGHKGYFQFGREATWGTAVVATHRLPYVSCDTRPVGGTVESEMMNASRWLQGIYKGPVYYETTLVLELWYAGMLLLLDGIQGTATFGANGGTTTGSNPYLHTITGQDVLNSYTFEIIEGNIEAGKCQRLVGAKIDKAVISGAKGVGADAICRLTLTLLSKSYQTDQTPTTSLTAIAALPVMFHETTTVQDGTADIAADIVLQSFSVSIDNRLARRQTTSIDILEPVPEGFCDITIQLQKELHTSTSLDAFQAFTAASANQPSLLIGPSSSKRVTILVPGTANIVAYNHPVTGAGIIMQDVTWKPFRAGTAAGPLTITVENTQATITT